MRKFRKRQQTNSIDLSLLKMPKNQARDTAPSFIEVDGECGYKKFRRFLFKSVYPEGESSEIMYNPKILIECDGVSGKEVYVEADGKQTLYELGDDKRIISIEPHSHVLGIIYRENQAILKWRDPGHVFGSVTSKTLRRLLSCNVALKQVSTQKPLTLPSMPTP